MSGMLAVVAALIPALALAEPPGLEAWSRSHPQASVELGDWVKGHPRAARKLFEWDGAHPERSREFVTWSIRNRAGPIQTFIDLHPGWPGFDEIAAHHRPAANAFMAWCRRHPRAAEDLMSHPGGLRWAARRWLVCVQFYNDPARKLDVAHGCEDCSKINGARADFAKGVLCAAHLITILYSQLGDILAHIFEVEEEQAVAIGADHLGRVGPSQAQMSDVRDQLDVARVCRLQHLAESLARFAESPEMRVITQLQAGVASDFAKLVHACAQSLDLVRRISLVWMAAVGHLQIEPIELVEELRVRCELAADRAEIVGVQGDSPARERDGCDLQRLQLFAQLGLFRTCVIIRNPA